MRTARLVGPTADGTSVVLVTEDGEEISVAVDPDDPAVPAALRPTPDKTRPDAVDDPAAAAPVRRPPRRRETPMDTPLSPRDIQTRIRSGESLEDVVAGSGMDAERIERFAAPVLAEREHLALTALGSSVRRRGEASGHRPLRSVVAERLQAQGVDGDDVSWDAWKVGDSQWLLSADYEVRGEPRRAEFRFDAQGRFSVAEDDEARWLAGEAPSPVTAVDREDELALVRATREDAPGDDAAETEEEAAHAADTRDLVRAIAAELGGGLESSPPAELSAEELAELAADDPESDDAAGSDRPTHPDEPNAAAEPDGTAPSDDLTSDDEPTLVARRDEAAEPTIAVVRHLTRLTVEVDAVEVDSVEVDSEEEAATPGPADEAEARSALDTLYDMLGGFAEESPRVYAGLSDATAVPVVDEHEFEPAADVLVPAEPDPGTPEPDVEDTASTRSETEPDETDPAETTLAEPPVDDEPEPLIPSPGASRKPGRRKRASVPSWDEIMFGGPKPG